MSESPLWLLLKVWVEMFIISLPFTLAFVAFSCFVAAIVGGFAPGTWAWGAIGPVGWLVAFIKGIGYRREQAKRIRRTWKRKPFRRARTLRGMNGTKTPTASTRSTIG